MTRTITWHKLILSIDTRWRCACFYCQYSRTYFSVNFNKRNKNIQNDASPTKTLCVDIFFSDQTTKETKQLLSKKHGPFKSEILAKLIPLFI